MQLEITKKKRTKETARRAEVGKKSESQFSGPRETPFFSLSTLFLNHQKPACKEMARITSKRRAGGRKEISALPG